jgi:hypothetical protein
MNDEGIRLDARRANGGFPGIVPKDPPKTKQPKTFSPVTIKPIQDIKTSTNPLQQ